MASSSTDTQAEIPSPSSDQESEESVEKKQKTDHNDPDHKSTCLIVLGMAGSGKSTFVRKLADHLSELNKDDPGYFINLDPACLDLHFPASIDIRDTIDYKRVMKEYMLGPNGAIITSLNLFTTKFNQVVDIIDQRKYKHKHIVFDTPGQIEVFNWSASGTIITESLASQMPTAIVYVLDIVRNLNPATFMSNMLYACSILYKTKLPLIVVLNKTDLQSHQFLIDWMTDFESFEKALEGEQNYLGFGMDNFLDMVEEARLEYLDVYLKERAEMQRSTTEVAESLSNLDLKEGAIPEEDESD